MADDGRTHSPEMRACDQGGFYAALAIAIVSIVVCISLALWIALLKRRQRGYRAIPGKNDELQRYKEMYEEERMEKEDALKRLSRLMADRLTDGNPNIANLSDMKRPTKLAEDFSELYDNAWTEAYESIGGKRGSEEKDKIGFLLQILEICFGWCKLQAADQLTQLDGILSCPGKTSDKTAHKPETVGKDLIKGFKDERKRLAGQTQNYVSERVCEAVKDKFKRSPWENELVKKAVQTYCKQCADLSWFLVVQDPAMDIQFSGDNMKDFKAYTKTGHELEFVVWPPLYLQEGGNVMSKGIAQFR